MKIYQSEINDNLQEALVDRTIAFECPIVSNDKTDLEVVKAAFENAETQPDLYYLNSVLVSAGWNKNDDVFSTATLWAARHTPVDKQFNFMHDETDIIGHMTASMVIDQNGQVFADDSSEDDLPEKIDIVTSAVIYKTWSDPEMRDRIEEITQEIDEGKWSVSMECIFNDFDYALISPQGETKTLARTEESAFLTKHLRAYGGKGEYEGYKVGRLLKDIYFSGKGLVDKPANPRSIILSKDVNPFNSKADITITNFLTAMETDNMSDVNEQVTQLEQDLSAAKSELETVKAELTQKEDDLNSAVAEKDQLIASLETKIKELEDAFAGMKEEKEKMEEENVYMKKKMKNMKRKASLVEAGASEEEADELLVKFTEADDDMFSTVVALVESKKPAPEPEPEPEPVEADEDEDDDEGADASELDNVDDVDSSLALEDDSDDVVDDVAKASEYFRNNVLKTTANLK